MEFVPRDPLKWRWMSALQVRCFCTSSRILSTLYWSGRVGLWGGGWEWPREMPGRAGGTDPWVLFCGFQVWSSRKLRPGLAKQLRSLLSGDFKDAYFVIGLVEVKMPRWRGTKDEIQEFDALSMLINCLLKWRQNVGWWRSTKKKRWRSKLDRGVWIWCYWPQKAMM